MFLPTALLVVTIRLFDVYGVPPSEFQPAMAAAAAALARAGVEPRFIDCSQPDRPARCATTLASRELIIRIRRGPNERSAAAVLGSAILNRHTGEGAVATIYADRVEALARVSGVAAGVVLGHAIAHELGHLLTGSSSHARRGLMRALWTSAELRRNLPGDWRFSHDESDRIRQRSGGRVAALMSRADN